jgi:membrane protein DedA with SNARE-associated domain
MDTLIIGYLVGSIVSYIIGYRNGGFRAIKETLDVLIQHNFVKTKQINGETVLLPLAKD